MKKRIVAFMMAALLCFLAVGCGSSGSAENSSESEASTEFTPKLDTEAEATVNIVGLLENFEGLEAVISDFEEYYPNCEVLYSTLQSDEQLARLKSDDSVGIFMMNSTEYSANKDFYQDICADLQSEDIDLSAIQTKVIDSCISDGKLYEIPLAQNTSGLVVNETLLENEGLSVPTNYEEFISVCDTLKEKGYSPIQGYGETNTYQTLVRNMAYLTVNKAENRDELFASMEAGEKGSAEILRSAYEMVIELMEAGYIDKDVIATYEDSYNDTILKFFEGDVPFIAASTETFSGMKKRETKSEYYSENPFDYEFICTPLGEDSAYSYVENWQAGFSVNENCPDKEWAVEFMRFLVTEEEINKLASVKGLPSVAKESDDERFSAIYDVSEENFYINDCFFPTNFTQAYWDGIEALVTGEATDVDGALDAAEATLRGETKTDE